VTVLRDRVVLVSGGTRGVGAAVAAAAVRAGARVVITGRRPGPGAEVATRLGATYLQYDGADVGQARAAVAATVAANGRLDGLVNAVAAVAPGSLLDTTPEQFDQQVASTLRGPFFLMQAAVADMVRRGAPGSIVNLIPEPDLGGQPYLAARAGLAALTRNAAHAHRSDHIRINGLDLGWTDLPTGRLSQPDEIADTVVFLLSDRSGVVTGSVLDWDPSVPGSRD
jgi:NAD(P)-dependent dehydrogenase (short-subunit alcohol dehydrogenase family)